MRSSLAAGLGALALALTTTTALAGNDIGLRGSIDGEYAHVDGEQDVNSDLWSGNVHLMLPLGSNFAIQGEGGYGNVHGDGQNVDGWDISGAAFWRNERGDVGVSVAHASFSGDVDTDVTAYGVFGEFFAAILPCRRAAAGSVEAIRSMGITGARAPSSTSCPICRSRAAVDQIHLNHVGHVTDWDVTGEWQVMDTTPLSLFGSYTHSDLSDSSFSFDTWMVGFRWRFGEPGGSTLEMGDRTNVVPNTTVNLTNALTF